MDNTVTIAGHDLSQFFQVVNGDGQLIVHADGSRTFSSPTLGGENRSCLVYQQVVNYGETIILRIKGAINADTDDRSQMGRFNILWQRNGNDVRKTDGFINSREIRSYEIAMTIDEPTQPGDYFRASFGNFADSKAEVLITDASILVKNSFLPIKRIVLSGLLKIGASKAGDLPTLSLNENFIQIPPDQISFDTDSKSIIISAPKYFKAANNTRSGVICGRSEICGDPSNADFAKYQAYSGGLNRTEGTAKLWVVDRTTNTLVDFKALVNPNPIYMQIQYELS